MKECTNCHHVFVVEKGHLNALQHYTPSQQLDDIVVCTCPVCGHAMASVHDGEQQTWNAMRNKP